MNAKEYTTMEVALLAALETFAYQCETIASLHTCGEQEFLIGLAQAMRKTIAKAEGA